MAFKDSYKFYKDGLIDEEFVMRLTEEKWGGKSEKSSRKDDIYNHIDFYWSRDGSEKIGFDVKGVKKSRRSDDMKDDSIHWVELLNVQGKEGWLYGKAKYIAFLTNTSILYVPRLELINLINTKIKNTSVKTSMPNECYVPYQRRDRMDLIVKVLTSDLRKIAKQELVYGE